MITCARCLLPETFPGVSFDERGVCDRCRRYEERKEKAAGEKERYARRFGELLADLGRPELRSARSHDVLMAYSGGKDSTYTLSLFRRKYGLRVLALSFDNGFVSPRAAQNIQRVTDELAVDHVTFKPRWDLLRAIFAAAAARELYPKKTLERASTICTSCMGLVKGLALRTAIEREIPLVGYGWSPGQAPLPSSIMKTNPRMVRMTQAAILGPLKEIAGGEVAAYFLEERHFADAGKFPWNVHPLAWERYDEGTILREIGKLGWRAPEDTDPNSSNCLLNAFANEVHVGRYGFHPYVWEISNMVREGVMSLAEGREKFREVSLEKEIGRVREKLGLASTSE